MRKLFSWVAGALMTAPFLAALMSTDATAAPATLRDGRPIGSTASQQAAGSEKHQTSRLIVGKDAPRLVSSPVSGGAKPIAKRATQSATSESPLLLLRLRADRPISANDGASLPTAAPGDHPWDARIQEIRFGLAINNVFDAEHKTGGVNAETEVVLDTPSLLRPLGRPRPYLMASLNSGDGADFLGVGLLWRVPLGRDWAIEPGFAYVVHNGAIDVRTADNSSSQRTLYGSRDLFRASLGVERRWSDRVGLQLFVAHYSHGQVLGHGRNQGSEEIGVRIAWRVRP